MSEENQENARATITINDIASVVEILRVVTDRGVWRVSELTGVGQLYDRLVAFLEAAGVTVNKPEVQEGSNQE
jgi:hypothetical protein